MKVWLKRVLIGMVVVFLVALVGVAIFLLTFDPNAYKNKLQEIVYSRYERTLVIDGDIELSLFPRIGLSVQDVSLSDRGNTDLFASMESARLAVAIWPLMFNRLVVDHVSVSGVQAWLTRDEAGNYNFDDLLSRRRAAPLPGPELGSAASVLSGAVSTAQAASVVPEDQQTDLHIDIAGLALRNGHIHLHDRKRGRVGHIAGLELNTGRITVDQPFDVAFRGRLRGDFPTADARFDGQALVRFNSDQKTYSAQRVNVQVSGLLGDLQAKTVSLRGNLSYSGFSQMYSANGLDFSVQGELHGPQALKNVEATLTVPQLKLDRSQAQLHVERLALRTRAERAGETFQLGVDAPNLSVSPDAARGEPLAANIQLQGKNQRLAMVLGMSGIGGNASQLTFKELKLDGRQQQGEQLVQVNMTSPATWHVFEERGTLSAMRGDVRIEHPALPGGAFEFPFIGSVAADLLKDHIRSELDAVLSGSKLGFRVDVKRLDHPQVDFALQADQLDFNTLFPAAAAKVIAPGTPSGESAQSEKKPEPASAQAEKQEPAVRTFNLAFLRNVDLSGDIDIGRLKVQEIEAAEFHTNVRAVDGRLTMSDIRTQLYEGKLSGKLTATADNEVGLDITAVGLMLDPLLTALTGESRVTGKATLNAKLNSQGMTMPALTAALDGRVQAKVRDGSVRGIDAAQTLRQVQELVRSVAKGGSLENQTSFDTGSATEFSELDADVEFHSGQGTLRKLNLVSPVVRVSQGKPAMLDLVNRQLNVLVNLRVAGSAREARDLIELRGVTVPVLVSGPFDDPSYQVQWKDIAGVAVREVVKDGLLELLGNQLERAVPGAPSLDATPAPAPGPDTPPPAKDPVKAIGEALKGLLGQ